MRSFLIQVAKRPHLYYNKIVISLSQFNVNLSMIKKFKLNTFEVVFVDPEFISSNLTAFFSFILRVI